MAQFAEDRDADLLADPNGYNVGNERLKR